MRVDYGLCLPNIHSPPSSNKKMETYKPAGERLADLLAENKEVNKKADEAVEYFQEQKEPRKFLIFTWKGLAKDWNLYSEHLKESFRERDEDVRSKIWAN